LDVKLKIVVLVGMAVAGLAASYALADRGGQPHHSAGPKDGTACRHVHLHGTIAAPQTLTVVVDKAPKHSPFSSDQLVTVTLGATGQSVDVEAEGCTTDGSTLTSNKAELHVRPTPPPTAGHDANHHGHHQTTTTASTTTDSTP
jgi:hypothetical protein